MATVEATPQTSLWTAGIAVQIALFLAVVVLSVWSMTYRPYDSIHTSGLGSGSFVHDPSYPIRSIIIVAGLVLALCSTGLAIFALRSTAPLHLKVVVTCLWIGIFALGWRAIPYFANGVFQAYAGYAPVSDFDPMALPPSRWIGPLWLLFVWLFYPVALVAFLWGLVALVGSARRVPGVLIVLAGLGLASGFLSVCCLPNYLDWILD